MGDEPGAMRLRKSSASTTGHDGCTLKAPLVAPKLQEGLNAPLAEHRKVRKSCRTAHHPSLPAAAVQNLLCMPPVECQQGQPLPLPGKLTRSKVQSEGSRTLLAAASLWCQLRSRTDATSCGRIGGGGLLVGAVGLRSVRLREKLPSTSTTTKVAAPAPPHLGH